VFIRYDSFLNMKNNMKTRTEKTKNKIFTNERQEKILEAKEKEKRLPESLTTKLYED